MFPQRTMLRAMRSPVLRRTTQRRLASTESSFAGAEDNAFNRERKAVKDHATATTGKPHLQFSLSSKLTCSRSLAQAFYLVSFDEEEGHWKVTREEGLT